MANHGYKQVNNLNSVSAVYSFDAPLDLGPPRLLAEYSIYRLENLSNLELLRVFILSHLDNIELIASDKRSQKLLVSMICSK